MDNLFDKKQKIYYKSAHAQLVLDDTFKVLPKIHEETIDMIFADPPYFLSNDGITCKSGNLSIKLIGIDLTIT